MLKTSKHLYNTVNHNVFLVPLPMYQHSVSEKEIPWITKPTVLLAGPAKIPYTLMARSKTLTMNVEKMASHQANASICAVVVKAA
jgi:hypothetical protein